MTRVARSACRSCTTYCPINVTIEDGRVQKIETNRDAPIYDGFICPKGYALKDAHNDPKRLTHHLKRLPDGSHVPISSEQLVAEISDKLRTIIAERGPRAVSTFLGGANTNQPASGALQFSFLHAIGSDSFYTSTPSTSPATS